MCRRGCWLLFTAENADLRYKAVPNRYLSFPDFSLTQAGWDGLEIPVGLVFFFSSSVLGRTVAFYRVPPASRSPSSDCKPVGGAGRQSGTQGADRRC